jgi:MFS family permease
MDHLGAAVGPLIAAAYLLARPGDLRGLFFLSIIPGVVVIWLVCRLPEPQAKRKVAPKLTLTLQPFGRDFRLFLIALLIFTLGNSTDLFLLVRASEMGVPQTQLPLLWSIFHIAKSGGNILSGYLVDRLGPRPLLVFGWIVYIVVYLLFALATAAWQAWALFLGYAAYYALTEPSEKTLVANLVGPDNKGLAFGWFNLIIGMGALPASVLFGGLYEWAGGMIAFGTSAALAFVSVAIVLLIPRRK